MEEFQLSVADQLYSIQLTKFKTKNPQVTNTSVLYLAAVISVKEIFFRLKIQSWCQSQYSVSQWKEFILLRASELGMVDGGFCVTAALSLEITV